MTPEEEAHFRVLKLLEQHPHYSQRELAEATGYSLGRTHYILHGLMEKGFLKLGRFMKADNKLGKTGYILTPTGIGHRLSLTQGYIERKKAEYEALRKELDSLQQEAPGALNKPPIKPQSKKV